MSAVDSTDAHLLHLAQQLDNDAAALEGIGGYNWSAYDLRYIACKLRKDAGVEGAFDAFNEYYAPKTKPDPPVLPSSL